MPTPTHITDYTDYIIMDVTPYHPSQLLSVIETVCVDYNLSQKA